MNDSAREHRNPITHYSKPIEVGIFIFDEVEVLDFAGPFEVLSLAAENGAKCFHVCTIAVNNARVVARNGLQVLPDYSFDDEKHMDILIVPGGHGAQRERKNSAVIEWIKKVDKTTTITASVCTGALILAETKLLDNKKATTHWMYFNQVEEEYPAIEMIRNTKYVEDGKIITSAGISAGIDMSFFIVQKLLGKNVAVETAKRMEYDITFSADV
ncbi:DJ-1/PfpI family protein [Filimonas effusa]|uniref:DJ-1/PfpI family protein n=1 Tax=Filimonas effusa TaxID=2508721 RepID=A0A4V1MAF9_9BACT|nr:DJ-1/PfpI family protein [Filimonas effusa]RXK85736.1 DJ-1/PfpI family protein [Filimonas effusa]